MTLVGQKVPPWTASAYLNDNEVTLSSKDFDGRWYVLYFYPADFTFVCPTEIRGFEELKGQLQEDGIGLVGASTDSFYSHQAWFADRNTFSKEITHPIIADTSHRLSRAFQVLKEDEGIAYRATFVIDDQGVVRSACVNDTKVGRSPQETLRTAQALISGGLCGVDWHKGDRFVT